MPAVAAHKTGAGLGVPFPHAAHTAQYADPAKEYVSTAGLARSEAFFVGIHIYDTFNVCALAVFTTHESFSLFF